ncbi:hypothetical protein NLI96_g13305 [Meripilus lineatus]|uniref:Uncharacterized protein n=1 Tax=Meripilus lineatus TaxID=2056292 RepID=A0AAD5YBM0_9APHY|nr:hypothetical protein NLI96_g13305 [Physisporinus lineatus]
MYVKYLERHAMAGVGMRVVRWQRVPVGVGKLAYDEVLGSMRLDREMIGMSKEELKTSKEKMVELGKKIIKEETAAAIAAGHPDVTPSAPPTKPN